MTCYIDLIFTHLKQVIIYSYCLLLILIHR